MKRISIITFLLFAFLPIATLAAPAWPFPISVKQPDGTWLTVQLHGDEHFNWVTTADDGVLLATKDNAFYIADINSDGRLTATTQLAHNQKQRTANEADAILRQAPKLSLFEKQRAEKLDAIRRAPAVTAQGTYFPHSSTPRVLVILASYQDKEFTLPSPKTSFDQYMNGETQENLGNEEHRNYCSVAKYFNTISLGQYTPQFDVVGPVKLPENMSYYGGTNNYGSDEKFTDLCRDACELVSDSVDFSLYDNDKDGKAELIYVIYAGYGQNTGGPANTMWAKCGLINITVNGTTIQRGGCHSELAFYDDYYTLYKAQYPNFTGNTPWINGTGPFIHEFSHGMGLPDLYITSSADDVKRALNQSMQSWDIMDYGLYNSNGYRPAAYTAWEQEAMGWHAIQELTGPATDITLTPIIDGGTAYKIQNPMKQNEYIVLENIQKNGLNSSARGHGLLAYHIDYNSDQVNMNDKINNTKDHPRVAIIPSGGISFSTNLVYSSGEQPTANKPYSQKEWTASHAATPFPGTQGVTTLTDEQALPNFKFYTTDNSGLVGHSLYDITEDTSNGIVTISYDMMKIAPIEKGNTIGFADFTEETILKNTTVGNVYYNLDSDSGDGYNAAEGCLVINNTTDMDGITNTNPGSPDIKNKFAGIILEVDGSGSLIIDCLTQGNSVLNVKIVDEPTVITQDEQGVVTIEYDVQKPTYVYLYATVASPSAPNRASAAEDAVKIYSIEVSDATGITRQSTGGIRPQTTGWYSLDGRRLSKEPTQKGIYIYKDKKVVIK